MERTEVNVKQQQLHKSIVDMITATRSAGPATERAVVAAGEFASCTKITEAEFDEWQEDSVRQARATGQGVWAAARLKLWLDIKQGRELEPMWRDNGENGDGNGK